MDEMEKFEEINRKHMHSQVSINRAGINKTEKNKENLKKIPQNS